MNRTNLRFDRENDDITLFNNLTETNASHKYYWRLQQKKERERANVVVAREEVDAKGLEGLASRGAGV